MCVGPASALLTDRPREVHKAALPWRTARDLIGDTGHDLGPGLLDVLGLRDGGLKRTPQCVSIDGDAESLKLLELLSNLSENPQR